MRHAIGLTFLATLAMPAWADDKPGGDGKLVGTWVLKSLVVDGKEIPNPDDTAAFNFSKDGKATVKENGKTSPEGTYKVTTTKTPWQIDVTIMGQPNQKPKTLKAIYQVDGDTLKFALADDPEGERPASFDKAKRILTFKRQKP
jgi:uncharacterized protein (TIGR03067 family)